MGTNNLSIKLCKNPEVAPNYEQPEFSQASLDEVVAVGNGTKEGKATVDFVFTDLSGQKHVAMITGALLKGVIDAVNTVNEMNGVEANEG